jgi:hypothetical protein
MGKSGNNSTCNPGGDINNSSTRDSEGSTNQSVIFMTVPRRQIKSGAYDPLEKVTGHQDDKPSTTETHKEIPMLGKTAAGEDEVFNNKLLATVLGNSPNNNFV